MFSDMLDVVNIPFIIGTFKANILGKIVIQKTLHVSKQVRVYLIVKKHSQSKQGAIKNKDQMSRMNLLSAIFEQTRSPVLTLK